MPTSTLWNRGDKLPRHGHPLKHPDGTLDPTTYNWHFASQIHRTDPDAHTREASFRQPNWARTKGDHNSELTYCEMSDLLLEAVRIHDAAVAGVALPSPKGAPELPAKPSVEQAPSAPAPAPDTSPTPSMPAAAITLELAQLDKRVDDAEGAALLAMEHAAKAEAASNAARNYAHDQFANSQQLADHKIVLLEARTESAIAAISKRVDATLKHEYVITTPTSTTSAVLPQRHKQFDTLLELVTSLDPEDRNIWIAGPMGSGKTTAARQLATVLNLTYDFNGAVAMDYKLTGYMDAAGNYHDTPFRRQYEHGGVWLGDECDGSAAAPMMELNAALSNSHMSFPDATISRHSTFIALAAANTWGLGGDANYVGRNKQDAAFLDRFIVIEWNYDEDFERRLALQVNPNASTWVDVVQEVRASLFTAKAVGMVVSPRSSIKGAQLLRSNTLTNEQVVAAIFGRYRNHSMWPEVGKAAEAFAKLTRPRTNRATPSTPAVTAPTNGKLPHVDMSDVVVFGARR